MLAIALLLAAPELFQAYAPDSLVAFRVPFLKFNVIEGRFNRFAAAITYDEDLTKGSVTARIESASLDSGFATRDQDSKSASFFEVEKYPGIGFRSTKVEKSGGGHKLLGELTLHGVTRPVALDLTLLGVNRDDPQVHRLGFLGRGKLSRKEFGVGHGPSAQTISDEVEIEIRISAQRQTWSVIPEKYPRDESKKDAAAEAAAAWNEKGASAALAKMRELRDAPGYDRSADQYIMLGAHLDTKGDAKGAAQVFEACEQAFPQDARCKVRLAMAYAAAGERSKARAAARRAVQVDPGGVGGLEVLRRLD